MEVFEDYLTSCHYAASTSSGYCYYVTRFLEQKYLGKSQSQCSLQEAIQDYRPRNHIERAALHCYYLYVTGERFSASLNDSEVPWINKELTGFFVYLKDIVSLELSTITAR